jgi:hypothetical protein
MRGCRRPLACTELPVNAIWVSAVFVGPGTFAGRCTSAAAL